METTVAYAFPSEVTSGKAGSALRLSPDLKRDPAHLVARVAATLPFRDALLALHDVARSELFVTQEEIEARALDPVVTVSDREVYFESFSLDESTYGRVTLRESGLADVERQRLGTTNVEFSESLRAGIEAIRGGSAVELRVASEGLSVATSGRAVEEKKIELADSWVHGFLAVQAQVRARATALDLAPSDLRNVLTYLKGRKETVSPRSLRFRLRPGRAPSVTVEPWNETLELLRSRHDAAEDQEVRVWGRRRLLLLQRALPGAKGARALLQGSGRPSFWTVDHGPVAVTLGLSPWTDRDWASLEPFELSDSPDEPSLAALVERAALALQERSRASASVLAARLGSPEPAARAALDHLCREGRALFEPEGESYVARRLFLGAPPPPAAPAERARAAAAIVKKGGVAISERLAAPAGGETVRARVKGNGTYDVTAVIDASGGLARGICSCPFFARHGLERGACKHLLALARSARPAG